MSRLVSTLLAVGAFAAAAPAGAVAPNVRGTISVARSLVCSGDYPCDPPAYAGTLVFSRSGRVAARVRIRAGHFGLSLASGRYAVRLEPRPQQGRLSPPTVFVGRSGATRLQLTLAP